MAKTFLRTTRWVLIATVCISACATTGCIESTFNLASESRLPRWFTLPPGLTPADVSVTLDYHMGPAKFTLRDKNGRKLTTVTEQIKRGPSWQRAPSWPIPGYPDYDVITANGITEIIKLKPYKEHENMVQNGRIVALFYVIDDPAIRKELLAGTGVQ